MAAETHGFQTEARKLLRLVINSLYSNKEVFLRELISNASDAIDRLRFASLSDPSLLGENEAFSIEICVDSEAGSLSVSDNGIGMTRDEVIANLGTIAKSGTEEFFDQLTGDQKADALLIGQFGVGFYSVFMVSDRVEVTTRKASQEEGTVWRSTGEQEFTVEPAECERGTRIELHLKEDAKEFLSTWRLKDIVRRYSDHISVPVTMPKDDDAEERETVNQATALWTRPRKEVTDDEYNEFYKHISHDFDNPLDWSHNKVEGSLEYASLLYVPKKAPFDLWQRERVRGLKLYVQRVFIMDDAEAFLPLYLRWVKGVVDSSDLPLNVSRETLQDNQQVASMRTSLTSRVLSMLKDLAEKEPDKYKQFWTQFGQVLKEGIGSDPVNQAEILDLLRFRSVKGDESFDVASLEQYVGRMNEGQEKIYYLVGTSSDDLAISPHLEVFKSREIEVLLLSDLVDSWMMPMLSKYEDKSFQDVSRGELDLKVDEPEKPASKDSARGAGEESNNEDADLITRLGNVLDDRVESVRRSNRLTTSAACLVLDENDTGHQLRRMLEASGKEVPLPKPHLEVNLDHFLLHHLKTLDDDERFADLAHVILDQAALTEGQEYLEAGAFVTRLNRLLSEVLA